MDYIDVIINLYILATMAFTTLVLSPYCIYVIKRDRKQFKEMRDGNKG